MKFVACKLPTKNWDDMDWLYNLIKDNGLNYDFFLVEAKSAQEVREVVTSELFEKAFRAGGVEYVIENAFWGFSGLEYDSDEDLIQYLGEKDGHTALAFYEKYTWDAFIDEKIRFYCELEEEDRDKFFEFDKENLKKLYKKDIWMDILVMPITKVLGEKGKGAKKV